MKEYKIVSGKKSEFENALKEAVADKWIMVGAMLVTTSLSKTGAMYFAYHQLLEKVLEESSVYEDRGIRALS